MGRAECLKALEVLQRHHVRCVEYQQHPIGNISCHSPWVLRAWDKNGLRVEFNSYPETVAWVVNYWDKE